MEPHSQFTDMMPRVCGRNLDLRVQIILRWGFQRGGGKVSRGEYQTEIGTWHFLLKPVSKVLNLEFQFFCIDFLANYEKNFMHYPKQDKQ